MAPGVNKTLPSQLITRLIITYIVWNSSGDDNSITNCGRMTSTGAEEGGGGKGNDWLRSEWNHFCWVSLQVARWMTTNAAPMNSNARPDTASRLPTAATVKFTAGKSFAHFQDQSDHHNIVIIINSLPCLIWLIDWLIDWFTWRSIMMILVMNLNEEKKMTSSNDNQWHDGWVGVPIRSSDRFVAELRSSFSKSLTEFDICRRWNCSGNGPALAFKQLWFVSGTGLILPGFHFGRVAWRFSTDTGLTRTQLFFFLAETEPKMKKRPSWSRAFRSLL